MADILNRILVRKTEEIAERSAQVSLDELAERVAGMPGTRGFAAAIEAKIEAGLPAVIAEVKRASPSKGLIRPGVRCRRDRAQLRSGRCCLPVGADR